MRRPIGKCARSGKGARSSRYWSWRILFYFMLNRKLSAMMWSHFAFRASSPRTSCSTKPSCLRTIKTTARNTSDQIPVGGRFYGNACFLSLPACEGPVVAKFARTQRGLPVPTPNSGQNDHWPAIPVPRQGSSPMMTEQIRKMVNKNSTCFPLLKTASGLDLRGQSGLKEGR